MCQYAAFLDIFEHWECYQSACTHSHSHSQPVSRQEWQHTHVHTLQELQELAQVSASCSRTLPRMVCRILLRDILMLGSWMEPVSVDFLKTCSTKWSHHVRWLTRALLQILESILKTYQMQSWLAVETGLPLPAVALLLLSVILASVAVRRHF